MTSFYVYLLASRRHGTLYLGITNDIVRRVHEHKTKILPGFRKRYGVNRLVWFEIYDDPATRDQPRERTQKMASRLEDPAHRRAEPGVARPLRNDRQVALRSSFRGAG